MTESDAVCGLNRHLHRASELFIVDFQVWGVVFALAFLLILTHFWLGTYRKARRQRLG